jgi:hypothetical protein
MSEVAGHHQLLVTLVHGTWPRGVFPALCRLLDRGPLWFEESSPFLARLSAEFGDIPHKIKPLLWTGENSIFVRDKTAQFLARYLSAEHTEHPQATQLIVAHSHGGNIALRALHYLRMIDGSQYGADGANPFVVTLATPFIEIHEADFGPRPLLIRFALMCAMSFLLFGLALASLGFILFFVPSLPEAYVAPIFAIYATVVGLALALMGWWWIFRRTARQEQLDALSDATRLGELVSAQRLLVVRAIDDEASLALALGAIVNYVTARFITYVLYLFCVLTFTILSSYKYKWLPWLPNWAYPAALAGFITLTFTLLGALSLSRSVHGCELAKSPMECQVNTQSVPDAADLSRIVTLVSHGYVKSLRHGIYEHENCAKAISNWVRSKLGASV